MTLKEGGTGEVFCRVFWFLFVLGFLFFILLCFFLVYLVREIFWS